MMMMIIIIIIIIRSSSGQSAWIAVIKWEVIIMGRDRLCGCCGKKNLSSLQIFIISYLPFVERQHMHTALFSSGYGAATLARKLDRKA
jgi:hypothetical protein